MTPEGRRSGRRALAVAAAMALVGTGLTLDADAALVSVPLSNHLCSDADNTEAENGNLQGDVPKDERTGVATEGYNCGIDLVGHHDLGGRGSNWNMAWSGDCAYITSSSGGIAVVWVDPTDPSNVEHVTTLRSGANDPRPASDATKETVHAVTTDERAILVAGQYDGGGTTVPSQNGDPNPMDVYDVSDCRRPRLVSTFVFPENVHNLTLSADGTKVFSTFPVQVVDLTDMEHPFYIGNIEKQVPYPSPVRYMSHEAWPSADGKRLYLGGQLPTVGYFTILDITGLDHKDEAGEPDPIVKVISQFKGRGHSIREMNVALPRTAREQGSGTVGGKAPRRHMLLHSEESIVSPSANGCISEEMNPFAGPAQPYFTDIVDEHQPKTVSQFKLEINEPQNCPTQLESGVNASVHYHDVDDENDTKFVMLSMWNAGMRVVDVRNPEEPREVAYFNPAMIPGRLDQAWGHVRYVAETGHIWFSTATGGFWVVQLQGQVLRHFDEKPAQPPAPVLPVDVHPSLFPLPAVPTNEAYCTLDAATSTLNATTQPLAPGSPDLRELPLPEVGVF
jgi:hypothetical protein